MRLKYSNEIESKKLIKKINSLELQIKEKEKANKKLEAELLSAKIRIHNLKGDI